MTAETVYEFFKVLEQDKISFTYRGSFSNTALAMATELIKNNMDEEHSKLRNKLSFLMIESFQNIARYADGEGEEEPTEESDFFMTRNVGTAFYVISANIIDNDKIAAVKEKLDRVNTSDKKALNDLYKTVLTNKQINEKGGAGLGFIEMVRKTRGKLPYAFVKLNEEHSIFFMQIKLESEEVDENAPPKSDENDVKIEDAQRIHKLVSSQRVLMMHKGSFSQEAVGPVLRMVEDNMHSMKLKMQKKVYHFLVEILQNISKHGYVINNDREGIFMIGITGGRFAIGTGNYIANEKIENLKSQIDQVNSMTVEELNEMYRKYLREGRVTETGSAGLGLIDLARETDEKIEYRFSPINEQYSFFSLTVKL
jgi:hypothetical protein